MKVDKICKNNTGCCVKIQGITRESLSVCVVGVRVGTSGLSLGLRASGHLGMWS